MKHFLSSQYSFNFILIIFLIASCAKKENKKTPPNFSWEVQKLDSDASIRGISAVNEKIAWLSGSAGTVARTTDSGKTWEKIQAPVDTLDYRDIEAFSENEAIMISIGPGDNSAIYKTTDGGKNWEKIFTNTYEEGFFNGIAFWDDQHGFLAGDPIEGHLFVLRTEDGGVSWSRVDTALIPPVKDTEYGFAASGTHVTVFGKNKAWIGTGGKTSRVFYSEDTGKSWKVADTPIIQGEASTGIFSLEFSSSEYGIGIGGDYTKEEEGTDNIIISEDGGKNWKLVQGQQVDYRSCVRIIGKIAIAVGPSGSDFSVDKGKTWASFGEYGFHTLSAANENLNAVWAAGSGGRVAKLVVE